jgi:hypothetical protein
MTEPILGNYYWRDDADYAGYWKLTTIQKPRRFARSLFPRRIYGGCYFVCIWAAETSKIYRGEEVKFGGSAFKYNADNAISSCWEPVEDLERDVLELCRGFDEVQTFALNVLALLYRRSF